MSLEEFEKLYAFFFIKFNPYGDIDRNVYII